MNTHSFKYDKDYYQSHCSVDDYVHNESMISFFEGIASVIKQEYAPQTVLDVGCACGHLVKALRNLGIEAYGVDVSEYALENADESISNYGAYWYASQLGSTYGPCVVVYHSSATAGQKIEVRLKYIRATSQ